MKQTIPSTEIVIGLAQHPVLGHLLLPYTVARRDNEMVQLAEQAKISISYLSKIEAAGCDKSLSMSALNQIANVLGVEISEFFKEV